MAADITDEGRWFGQFASRNRGSRRDAPAAAEELPVAEGYSCDLNVPQAFDFDLSRQAPVGFITSLKLGGATVQPQFGIPGYLAGATASPSGRSQSLAVGVLESMKWLLGDTDPIAFEVRIPPPAKQQIMMVQYAQQQVVDVTVAWVVYDYDEVGRQYYVAFSNSSASAASGTPVQGQLLKNGRNIDLRVGSSPAGDVPTPQNFKLHFSIVPKDHLTQSLYLATGALLRVQKTWGRI